MNKKLVSLVLVAAMALGITACGKEAAPATPAATEPTVQKEASEKPDWTVYDNLISEIRVTTDLAKRAELMHQAEDMLMDTWCVIPIYYYTDPFMVKDSVKGIYYTSMGMKYFYNAQKSDLNIWMSSEPDHIDPALNSSVDGGCLAVNSFEGLLRYNAAGQLEPACAESYTVSDDGTVYTFTMRDGLTWSNGSALDATDFEYSWKRAAKPELAADYSYLCEMFAGFTYEEGLADSDVVASEDGKTLTVTLNSACPYFLDLCAFPYFFPVCEEAVEGNDAWASDAGASFVTNGAFTLQSWNHDTSMVYVKNPSYWDAANVTVDTLNVMLTSDDVAAYTAYQNGDLDFIDSIPTAEMKAAMATSEFVNAPQLGTYYAGFNITSKIYDDLGLDYDGAVTFRKAIALLIDRDYICEAIGQAGQKPANTFVPEGCSDGNGGNFRTKAYYSVDDYDANVAEAKALLESIGLYDTAADALTQPIEFVYLTNNSEGNVRIAEAIQSDLASTVGINMTIEQQEWKVFLNTRKEGQFDFAREGWVMDYNDPINMLEMWTTNSGNNDCQFGRY